LVKASATLRGPQHLCNLTGTYSLAEEMKFNIDEHTSEAQDGDRGPGVRGPGADRFARDLKALSAAKEHTNEERGGGRNPGVRRPGAGRSQLPARSKIFFWFLFC